MPRIFRLSSKAKPNVQDVSWQQKLFGQANAIVWPAALRLLDIRVSHYDRSADPARREYNQHGVNVFWHEYVSVVLPVWRHTPSSLLCSQHRDGEWVNQLGTALGLHVVRGSSSRGGSSALRELKKNAEFSCVCFTPDGPRGPRRKMAMGPIFLASRLQMPIVCMGVGVNKAHRLNTWDKFAIPHPFSRARIIFGPKVMIPAKADRATLEHYRQSTETLLNQLSDAAEDWAISGKKMQGEQRVHRGRRPGKIFFPETPQLAASNEPTAVRRAA